MDNKAIIELIKKDFEDHGVSPNFQEGTKVKLIHYDPLTGVFTEGEEEIVNDHTSHSS